MHEPVFIDGKHTKPASEEPDYRLWHVASTAALVIAVAATQHYFAHTQNLTPWKGGGFGMFSTIDSRATRIVECSLIRKVGDREELVRVPIPSVVQPVRDAVSDIKSLPTQARVDDLAYNLARLPWAVRKRRAEPSTPGVPEDGMRSSGDEAFDTRPEPAMQLRRSGDESPSDDPGQAAFDSAIYVEPDARPGDPRLVPISGVVLDVMVVVSSDGGSRFEKKRMFQARAQRPPGLN